MRQVTTVLQTPPLLPLCFVFFINEFFQPLSLYHSPGQDLSTTSAQAVTALGAALHRLQRLMMSLLPHFWSKHVRIDSVRLYHLFDLFESFLCTIYL